MYPSISFVKIIKEPSCPPFITRPSLEETTNNTSLRNTLDPARWQPSRIGLGGWPWLRPWRIGSTDGFRRGCRLGRTDWLQWALWFGWWVTFLFGLEKVRPGRNLEVTYSDLLSLCSLSWWRGGCISIFLVAFPLEPERTWRSHLKMGLGLILFFSNLQK